MPKLEDLKFYMSDNGLIGGIDKKGNEYGIHCKTGNLFELPKHSIDLYWGGITLEDAKKEMARIKSLA